jgi:hypothetical protein
MSEETINILLFFVGAELFFLLFILCLVMFLKGVSRKKKDRKAAETLVQNIKENEDSRREKLQQVFSECYDLKDEELNKVVDEFISREHAFYKYMISAYQNRDAAEFAQLNIQLEEVVKPYPDLALSNDSVGQSEIESLREANEELSVENTSTKELVDQLKEENSRAFDDGKQAGKSEALEGLPDENAEITDREEDGRVGAEKVLEQEDLTEPVDEDLDFISESEDDIIEDIAGGIKITNANDARKVIDSPEKPITTEPEEVLDDLDLLVSDMPENISEDRPKKSVAEELSDDLDLITEEAASEEELELTEDDEEAIISDIVEDLDEDVVDNIVEDMAEDKGVVSEDSTSNDDLADLVAEIQTVSVKPKTVIPAESEPVETEIDLDLMIDESSESDPVNDIDELLAENSGDLGVEELRVEENKDLLDDDELEALFR